MARLPPVSGRQINVTLNRLTAFRQIESIATFILARFLPGFFMVTAGSRYAVYGYGERNHRFSDSSGGFNWWALSKVDALVPANSNRIFKRNVSLLSRTRPSKR